MLCWRKSKPPAEPFLIFNGHKTRVSSAYVAVLLISEAISCWVVLPVISPAFLLDALIPAQISQSKIYIILLLKYNFNNPFK